MKKLSMIILLAFLSLPLGAQDDLFVILELMHVDNQQELDYEQTEKFWKEIHAQRVADESILAWELWSLLPGGEDQGYQYATATLFDSAEKMFKAVDFMKYAKAAYPDMSENQLSDKLWSAGKTRDLAVRIFMQRIAWTKSDFQIKIGGVAHIDFMKVPLENYAAYETAEKTVFQPMHQKMVDDGAKGLWALLRFMIPIGSETYASHITVNMFENMKHALDANNYDGQTTEAQIKDMNDGIKTRDMKFVYTATLIDMVR